MPPARACPWPVRLAAACALLAIGLLLSSAPGLADDDFEAQRERYEAYLERPSLFMRTRGRVRFAETGDPRALALLMRSYARPEEPKDQVRYLIASICADHFRDARHLQAFQAWRKRNLRARDAWLWYCTLDLEHEVQGAQGLLALARSRRPGVLRAAAVEALGLAASDAVLPLAAEIVGDLPVQAFDRMLLVEAAAHALWRRREARRSPAWIAAAEAVFAAMDEKGTSARTRLVLARRFAAIFESDTLHLRGADWRALLHGQAVPPPAEAGERHAVPKRPRFLGLEGTGSRIVYVIDLSDSMLTPLTEEELEDLRKQPPDPRRKTRRLVREDEPGAASLDWDRIRTRFDAARAFLRLSLEGLDPNHSFCVIPFGSAAAPMKATPGLRRASPENVKSAIAELEAIEPGPKTESRPHGTLRGYTNLHGGLARAYQVTDRGLVRRPEYVDPITFEKGCDTIFLLSDGRPTWDDWPAVDTLEREDESGDPEEEGDHRQHKTGHFYGPYALATRILDDVRRLNLFRKVEIHCVGLGEYDPRLLAWLARTGLGRFRRIGSEGKR